jgi:hypothetical protein
MTTRIIFLLSLIFIFTACNNDDDSSGGSDSGSFFQCKIDGQDYKITGETGAYAKKTGADLFVIYGSEDATKQGFRNVYISLTAEPTTGTYEITNNDVGSGSFLQPSTAVLYNSAFPGGSGKLIVTEKTATNIKGTFEYVAPEASGATKKVITGGSFDVKIK